jgi:hypothetical protein
MKRYRAYHDRVYCWSIVSFGVYATIAMSDVKALRGLDVASMSRESASLRHDI